MPTIADQSWTKLYHLGLLGLAFSAYASETLVIIWFYFFAAISILLWRFGEGSWNLANGVTLLRAAVTLAALCSSSQTLMFGLLVALLLDGLDGFIARRLRCETQVGSMFDVELDSLTVLSMTMLIAWSQEPLAAVIFLGLLRSIVVVLRFQLWPAVLQERRSSGGRLVFLLSYLVILAQVVAPSSGSTWALLSVGILLTWSFSLDLIFFMRQNRRIQIKSKQPVRT
ncbi:CDP-alcohol phosphatidyltransferase family protein [Pseudobacteriovorax antillogorgiicola]|uniref:CDP-alcohol phosphatidyltransferase n=1 Tax=Pseudobacteriovorax antillogorgiicola TaxID=1513793 RepID=A0A1Y6C367_9BACT|nr:CDP-alcohol phosphatidyltransferase family protein [Pseudobacteriovorax antillogorgiicola]TCS49820.1 CDP-alcohol phosphatidyltransferase-like enzyme [Pseudobacteriovorax antillogorgiicola]SMF43264.1 CDP-alcohol phosphatidyltransferase [Pseudobacteriovorax antillogorgiicola]